MEFSRQEHWSGFPFSSPGDLAVPVIKPGSPALQADYLQSESPGKTYLLEFVQIHIHWVIDAIQQLYSYQNKLMKH